MGERRGTKALETWCRRVTQGYPGVKVDNMTTSWRDGLAFCALIHHFRPDLIDFSRLEKSDVYGNNDLAFRIAERHLGIPALLDAEDMAEYPVPDRLSILTYLSQFYQAFASNNSSPVKKPSSPDGSLVSLVQGNVQSTPKMEWRVRGREPCIVCNQPVFIAQRLRVDGRLYHRTCFRCARCEAQLSTADYYETCSGKYVCETCPDEMPVPEETVPPQQQEPLEPPPLPAIPPPSAPPPEPPPSIVAMRRLMFDTDDAKLGKHDHIVHNTRIINSIKKDLSMNDDSRSRADNIIDNKTKDLVNSDIVKPKDSCEILEADSSEALVESVNSFTIPACSGSSVPQRMEDEGHTSPGTSENEDSNAKLTISNPEEDRPLDLSDGTPSFNDNCNSSNVENVLYSDSDDNNDVVHNDISIVVTEDTSEIATEPDSTAAEAINTEVIPTIETRNEIVIAESDRKDDLVESETNEHPENCKNNIVELEANKQPENCKNNIVESETKEQHEYGINSIVEAETKEYHDDSENNIVEVKKKEYPDDLNPFDSDDNDDNDKKEKTEEKKSTNPFGSDSEEESLATTVRNLLMKPPPRANNSRVAIKSQTLRPMMSTNPFGSSDEDEDVTRPVPLPRKSLQSSPEPTPFPRRSKLRSSGRSITSLSSLASSTSPRKKRPAPPPPSTGASPTIGMSPTTKASPTIGGLTPSSRYSSMSSLASTRSRKTRRAPLPPTFMKTPDKPVQQTVKSEEEQAVPQLDISQQFTQSGEPSLETTGDIYNQIEEGMKKLIDDHDKIKDTDIKISPKDEKDIDIKISLKDEKDTINESSKFNLTVDENECLEESTKTEAIHLETTSLQKNAKEEENKEVSPNLEVVDLPSDVNKEQNVGGDGHITVFEELNISEVVATEAKPKGEYQNYTSLVEACNSELKSISRNSSGMFEGMEPIKHSTPVKISFSHIKDSSTEDIASGNSFSESFYPSPAVSVADSTSYQESLSSPPSEKKYKDSTNMHRKISVESGVYYPPKSTYGQWKRKKPAPPVPLPQRRIVKPMAMHRIKQELGDIEVKQQELERQGVTLENKIREKFDSETSITPYVEELVLQLFELVNEKNELFRKQAELMYLRRQHQLEEEHAELEYQIRCLMARPELNKTDTDKELEEKLIQRLVEVVERRDAIVQCLEMDRIREAEEDRSIHKQLDRLSQVTTTDERMKVTKKHKKKKEKHNTLKMLDLDKEFDESEKESRKKKKWYTLHHKMGKHL